MFELHSSDNDKHFDKFDVQNTEDYSKLISSINLNEEAALVTPVKSNSESFMNAYYSNLTEASSKDSVISNSTKSYSSPRSGSIFKSSYRPSIAIGSLWTVEMTTLQQAGSHFEAVQCFRRIRILLCEVDRTDRLKFCKKDYDNSVKTLRKQKRLWSPDLFKEAINITIDFFSTDYFRKLPTEIFREILLMIPTNEYCNLFTINTEWCDVGLSDETWSLLYQRKFLLNNPGPLPLKSYEYLVESYRQRLNDPHIGDKIEVAWRGKFRLETQDVYQGLAWWVAEVVDKHSDVGRYKIRYPGWDSRWDEWVPRSRLRWKVSRNHIESIRVGDVVELWCCGASVPGAWLETKVKRVRHGRYCLGKVISSRLLWVDRDRLRLVSRPSSSLHSSEPIDDHHVTDHRRQYSFMSSALAYAGNFLSSSRNLDDDAGNEAADPPTPRGGGCSIM